MKDYFRDIGEGTIRRISWVDLIPVVFLARIPRLALRLPILLAALTAIVLTLLIDIGLSPELDSVKLLDTKTAAVSNKPVSEQLIDCVANVTNKMDGGTAGQAVYTSFRQSLFEPCREFLKHGCCFWFAACDVSDCSNNGTTTNCKLSTCGHNLLRFFLTLVIWTYFGGMICRAAAVRLTVRENESPRRIHRYLARYGMSIIWAIVIPLAGIVCCYIPIMLIVNVLSIPFDGWLTVIFYPFALLAGLFIAILGVAFCVGIPLMFAATAVDGSDAFDAVSRMYSYVYQRPLHYIFYSAVAVLLTLVTYVGVTLFIHTAIIAVHSASTITHPTIAATPSLVIAFWTALFQLLQMAFLAASFWVSAVAIYLLLRKSVDDTPLREIHRLTKTNEIPAPVVDNKI
ncbi:MAG: hypothetical protein LBU65_05225 [Planctomycetaceae bacterium]|jgi:hypothetical protein|nr:hypothetical protein [Planctomycetaceae bacterium]